MSCSRAVQTGASGRHGFTLIEMLVVMVLLGMLSTMALPAMQRWYDAVQAKSRATEVVQTVRAAVFAAGAQRRTIRLSFESFVPESNWGDATQIGFRSQEDLLRLRLPAGWRVEKVYPATFLSSGLCESGSALLESERGVSLVLNISGPLCNVTLDLGKAAGVT